MLGDLLDIVKNNTTKEKSKLVRRLIVLPMDLNLGDIVELKKQHACGCKQFEIVRVGMDIKIKCTNCKRLIMLDRQTLEKRIKKIVSK